MKVFLGILALLACAAAEDKLPVITLPWGKWQAKNYSRDSQIYLFENVRFGAKPERFGVSSFPTNKNSSIQNITQPTSCIQVALDVLRNPPGGRAPLDEPENPNLKQSEDCLFLDIYAPAKAFKKGAKPLPVIVWIYGGAYAFGSKNQGGPLYNGQPILEATNYSAIFVTGNYRVGAFGFLAGSYMESVGQPNAGLYDQALLFQWVQKYIKQVHGDAKNVSAWGESAGAGSIMHHLIREEGKKDPLFKTYVAMSPAAEWAWDNAPDGRLDRIYKDFSRFAGCGYEYNMTCLRNTTTQNLIHANQKLYAAVRQTGLFSIGPSVDGRWVKKLPKLSFHENKVWKNISSGIISHTGNEAKMFTPDIESQERLDTLLAEFIPGSSQHEVRKKIKYEYGCRGRWGPLKPTWQGCTQRIIRDLAFTCNTRDMFDIAQNKSYMLDFSFPLPHLALHGVDLIALFANRTETAKMLEKALGERKAKLYADTMSMIQPRYRKYLATFALTGDPNPPGDKLAKWPKAVRGKERMEKVLQLLSLGFHITKDGQNKKSKCDFWIDVAKQVTLESGRDSAYRGTLNTQSSDEMSDL